jgi:hypothetical protein
MKHTATDAQIRAGLRALKPRITVDGMADSYAAANERIVEFSNGAGTGGLISFRVEEGGKLTADLYRADEGVVVRHTHRPAVSSGLNAKDMFDLEALLDKHGVDMVLDALARIAQARSVRLKGLKDLGGAKWWGRIAATMGCASGVIGAAP